MKPRSQNAKMRHFIILHSFSGRFIAVAAAATSLSVLPGFTRNAKSAVAEFAHHCDRGILMAAAISPADALS